MVNETSNEQIYNSSGVITSLGEGNLTVSNCTFIGDDGQSSILIGNNQNFIQYDIIGLHPDVNSKYLSLIEKVNNSVDNDIINLAVSTLRSNINEINNNLKFRNNILSYLDYLQKEISSYNKDEKNIELNKHLEKSDIICPIGLEYTYHCPEEKTMFKITGIDSPTIDNLISVLKITLREKIKKEESRIYNDQGLVEICSPVHKTKKDLINWFEDIDEFCKGFKMKPKNSKKGGGGLHFNLSYNKDLKNWKLTYINFFMFIINYPELNWIFNEPSDNNTANGMQKDNNLLKCVKELESNGVEKAFEMYSNIGSKSSAISCKNKYHFELRIFEMVRSKDELIDFLNFVNSLLKLSNDLAIKDIKIPLFQHPISMLDGKIIYHEKEKTAVKDFNKLLKILKLDPKRYNKYVKRNFYVRKKQYGKKYLT